ncbi:hypothetical protein IJ096_03110 [Candidatus Saccharibacteria bacterium]|nr:hypothetical protein [Candidatus Saccharibacteria bacterium]
MPHKLFSLKSSKTTQKPAPNSAKNQAKTHHISKKSPSPNPASQKAPKKYQTIDDLINAESALGRTLFGPIPKGHRREFFQHKPNLWLWHESWTDSKGAKKELTVRYEVLPTGVFKKPLGGQYVQLRGAELENFRKAVHTYTNLVKTHLY